jgi:hypothetical protein
MNTTATQILTLDQLSACETAGLSSLPPAIGYIIYLIGCVTYALGPILQKWALLEREYPSPEVTEQELVERGTECSDSNKEPEEYGRRSPDLGPVLEEDAATEPEGSILPKR